MLNFNDCKYNSIGKRHYDARLGKTAFDFAKGTYTIGDDARMDISAMEKEGFCDISCIYDCTLVDGTIENLPKVRREHLSRGKGTTRAAVGIRPSKLSGKRAYVVSIAFNGTVYDEDWIINFHALKSGEKHAGFDRNTREFAKIDHEIVFPTLQKSLQDVLKESGEGNEVYRYFVVGHSMGAAIAQLYIAEFLMGKYHIPPSLISGYTFASPCPVDKSYASHTEEFPIFNIISTDDIVPKTGPISSVLTGNSRRLGKELIYSPDDDFRKKAYFRSAQFATGVLKIKNYISDTHELLDAYKNIVENSLVSYVPKLPNKKCPIEGENCLGGEVAQMRGAIFFSKDALYMSKGGDIFTISSHRAHSIISCGEYLYYINLSDGHPYRLRIGCGAEELILRESSCLYLDGAYLYYKDFFTGMLYRLRADGAGEEEELFVKSREFLVKDNFIYYIDEDNGFVYSTEPGGRERKCVLPFSAFAIRRDKRFLYASLDEGIWKIDLKKEKEDELIKLSCTDFVPSEEDLYYTCHSGLYYMKKGKRAIEIFKGKCALLGCFDGTILAKPQGGRKKVILSYEKGRITGKTVLP